MCVFMCVCVSAIKSVVQTLKHMEHNNLSGRESKGENSQQIAVHSRNCSD